MITFANGMAFETVNNIGGQVWYQGAKRDTLEFRISENDSTLEELNALVKNAEATNEITVTSSEGVTIYNGYTVPMGVGLIYTDEGDAELYIKLAQKSEIELKVEQLEAAVAALTN